MSAPTPGATRTELATHNRPDIRKGVEAFVSSIEALEAGDIANAGEYVVTCPRRVAVNEILVRPAEQGVRARPGIASTPARPVI